MEKVLPYDRAIAPQERFYWCGPASTQMILNSRGIIMAEADLANLIGTTENGTDHIGMITPVLNRFLGAQYVVTEMRDDPPTPLQVDRLWQDIRSSIDAGFGVSVNIVAPPSNYPRGVKGSVSPAYSGGTVYHYVAVMGYDDAEEAVWVADSGFRPFGYWCSLAQLSSLIPPKGYAANPVLVDEDDDPLWEDIRLQLLGPRG
ncbi:C39 family peptidase [Rhodococcus koreensis]